MFPLPWLVVLATLLLSGCSAAPKEEIEFAKYAVASLRAGRLDEVESLLDPVLRQAGMRANLMGVAEQFPHSKLQAIRVGTWRWFSQRRSGGHRTRYDLQLEYAFSERCVLVSVVLQHDPSGMRLLGIHATPNARPLAELHRFHFSGKSTLHYVCVLLALSIPAFVLYTLVLLFKTPDVERRWRWILFVVACFPVFTLDWTTGALGVQVAAVQVLGAGIEHPSAYGSWLLKFGFPLGALSFLAKRQRLARAARAQLASPAPAPRGA